MSLRRLSLSNILWNVWKTISRKRERYNQLNNLSLNSLTNITLDRMNRYTSISRHTFLVSFKFIHCLIRFHEKLENVSNLTYYFIMFSYSYSSIILTKDFLERTRLLLTFIFPSYILIKFFFLHPLHESKSSKCQFLNLIHQSCIINTVFLLRPYIIYTHTPQDAHFY